MKKPKANRTPFYATAIAEQIRKERRIEELKKLIKSKKK
jgi:hypothetical protein